MTTTTLQTTHSMPALSPSTIFCEHYRCRMAGVTLPKPPSTEGGDWVRVTRVAGGFIAGVGDVAGHGDAAAPLARLMSREFDACLDRGITAPEDILHGMNTLLRAHHALAGATIIYCDGRRIVAASAGAPTPILFQGGNVDRLRTGGMLLGVCGSLDLDIVTQELPLGSIICLHSDSVTDTEHSVSGDQFPVERFAHVLDSSRSPAANLVACLDAVFSHGPQQDDISLLLVHASYDSAASHVRASVAVPPRLVAPCSVAAEYALAAA